MIDGVMKGILIDSNNSMSHTMKVAASSSAMSSASHELFDKVFCLPDLNKMGLPNSLPIIPVWDPVSV